MADSLQIRLPIGPQAAVRARQALDRLASSFPPEVLENLRLLTSELVTNSVRHSGMEPSGTVGVQVTLTPSLIRVEVTDLGRGFEYTPIIPSLYQTSGWGLYLVEQIADRWGVARKDGTLVWFEMEGDWSGKRAGRTEAVARAGG
jgi:anti-sigma regulatory factor (Ser/Thr protein kinase)